LKRKCIFHFREKAKFREILFSQKIVQKLTVYFIFIYNKIRFIQGPHYRTIYLNGTGEISGMIAHIFSFCFREKNLNFCKNSNLLLCCAYFRKNFREKQIFLRKSLLTHIFSRTFLRKSVNSHVIKIFSQKCSLCFKFC
jgi:hypothetical protein